jgi:hypothetical protein
MLCFFQRQSFKETGAAEDAVRKRVARALYRLTVSSFSAVSHPPGPALSVAVSAHGIQAARASLATIIVSSSLATGMAAKTITTLNFINVSSMSRFKIAAVATVAITITMTLLFQHRANVSLRRQNQALAEQNKRFLKRASDQKTASRDSGTSPEGQFSELLRLRGEVGILRGALAEASAPPLPRTSAGESGLHKTRSDSEAAENKINRYIPIGEWSNLGVSTPEAALQTMFWAIANRDATALVSTIATANGEIELTPVLITSVQELAEGEYQGVKALTVKSTELLGDDVAIAVVELEQMNGSKSSHVLELQRSGGAWRIQRNPSTREGSLDIPKPQTSVAINDAEAAR